MRVITGSAKGTKLVAPKKGTRPLTDRIKTSIFDLISEFIPQAKVLDLFAGSGSFGIEALSRGAVEATFVDLGSKAIECIEQNLERTNLIFKSKIIRSHVNDFIVKTDEKYDLIFLDPPFDTTLDMDFSGMKRILRKDGLIIYRIPTKNEFDSSLIPLEEVYSKKYGKSIVYFLRNNS